MMLIRKATALEQTCLDEPTTVNVVLLDRWMVSLTFRHHAIPVMVIAGALIALVVWLV